MSDKKAYVIDILGAYHGTRCGVTAIGELDPAKLNYLELAGLAPIAHQVAVQSLAAMAPAVREWLYSANLTAWVIYQQLRKAMIEILQQATAKAIPVTLLKGISIADDYYNQPHQRIMGDIDLLVRPEHALGMLHVVQSLGYVSHDVDGRARTRTGHHHLPGLRHPVSGVAVEIHTFLVSRTLLADSALIGPETFQHETRESSFEDTPCLRFSVEFQIVYTTLHWVIDQKWAVNIISINDLLHLLRQHDPSPDWQRVAQWMEQCEIFGDALTVLMICMADCGLVTIPEQLEARVRASVKRLGGLNLRLLLWLIRTYPLTGRCKVGWAMTRLNARITWLTLLEPRPRYLRPVIALTRVVFRRTKGKSLLGSVAGRIHTLLGPNE